MERKKVTSSNIDSIGYDSNLAILEIEFLDGGIYQYFNVNEGVYNNLMSAGSHGKYFNQFIEGNYRFQKIR
jgi:hypothetical protein